MDARRVFLKKGTCSHTFFYLLNREFGHLNSIAEQASDPLAGGMAQEGYQCGMLWGAALGAGAEANRKFTDSNMAISAAVNAAKEIHDSFVSVAKSADCSSITSCDFNSKYSLAKFLLSGKPVKCFNLAARWAPGAIQTAKTALTNDASTVPQAAFNCASETVRLLGGSSEEIVMAAGFAGGYGLSGNACGALAAAIWMKTLAKVKQGKYEFLLNDPDIEKIKEKFWEETGYKMECRKICGRNFNNLDEHTEYIKNGGCSRLISVLGEI